MAGGLGLTQCKRCLEEMEIEVKVVDGCYRKGVFVLGGCEVHAVPRIAARHTTTRNHSVTDDVLVVGTTEVPGLGTP